MHISDLGFKVTKVQDIYGQYQEQGFYGGRAKVNNKTLGKV